MDNRRLLDGMGLIDEAYIEEASDPEASALTGKRRNRRMNKKAWIGSICALLAVVVAVGVIVPGIGRGHKMAEADAPGESPYYSYEEPAAQNADIESSYKKNINGKTDSNYNYETPSDEPKKQDSTDVSDPQTANVKLVYKASVEIQSTDFEKDHASIKALVDLNGGYFEKSDLRNGTYFDNGEYGYKAGYFTIRIPAERYKSFINGIGDGFSVTGLNETVDDIGTQYFDTEQRLATLKIKEERLQSLLQQAKDLSDIIVLENELSENEYQINRLQSTLNKYDSLVGYATINLTMTRVTKVSGTITEKPGFFEKLGKEFASGFENFVWFLEDVALWISYNFFTLILLAVIIIVLCKIKPVKKIKAAAAKRKEEKKSAEV